MYEIDWSNIKNGAGGFESLALEYVKNNYVFPNGKWKKTPGTHDNNKDAYTVIFGFHPVKEEKEVWWMEAKYSKERDYLSRFKLDATIVSSIFDNTVKKIIFVTNIELKAKVISDVRTALYKGTSCKESFFCTKKTLEFWLHNNPSIYKRFFCGEFPLPTSSPDLFISEDLEIYTISNSLRSVKSLVNIISSQNYEAHFKVISNTKQKVKITPAQRGIKNLSDSSILLEAGENTISILFRIEEKYFTFKKHTYDGMEENNLCFFKINSKIPVITHYPVSILNNIDTKLNISSQIFFERKFNKINYSNRATYFIIDGKKGTGKSTTIKRCIENKILNKDNYRYIELDTENNSSNKEIIATIFYVFFPYIYFDDLKEEYLQNLSINSHLKNTLVFLLNNYKNRSEVYNYIKGITYKERTNFIEGIMFNPQIIILDNISYLDEFNLELLFFMLIIFKKIPFIFIIIGNSYIWEQESFTKHCIQINYEKFHFELTIEDIIQNMNSIFSFSFDLNNSIIEYFFPNIIIFKIYISYVLDQYECIDNIDDFILSYIRFKKNYVSNEYINEQFQRLCDEHPKAMDLCYKVYMNKGGIPSSSFNYVEIRYLIKSELIRYNEFNYLVPINDIYEYHFKRFFSHILDKENSNDQLIEQLIMSIDKETLWECYKEIYDLRKQDKFNTVNYILENVFDYFALSEFQHLWGNEIFYLLYYEYTYSAINCNQNITGYDNLKTIYEGIKGSSSLKLKKLTLEILFELINCDYNNGDYDTCRKYHTSLITYYKNIYPGNKLTSNQDNFFILLSDGYMLLIDSEEDVQNVEIKAEKYSKFMAENFKHNNIDFCRQFSKTLYTKNLSQAFMWISRAFNLLPPVINYKSKQYCKVSFDYYFVKYLICPQAIHLEQMKNILLQSRDNFYSSYRHMLFLYCSCLYLNDNIDEADMLFFKDIINVRPVRNKMKGHYYILLAFHYLKHNNIELAKSCISNSIIAFHSLKNFRFLALHNHMVLETKKDIHQIQYSFCTSKELCSNTFYLDPRM